MNDTSILLKKYNISEPKGGIWIESGWVPLVDKLFETIIELGWDKDLHQVKEKHGSLRIYIGDANQNVIHEIERAEFVSAYICEFCGRSGEIRSKNKKTRLKCTCDECFEKL